MFYDTRFFSSALLDETNNSSFLEVKIWIKIVLKFNCKSFFFLFKTVYSRLSVVFFKEIYACLHYASKIKIMVVL